jgi:peroxiredoxin Q/BCP
MTAPALNKVVADFACPATGDKTVRLKSLRGKKVVLYFYPKDSTPGCTTEAQDFRDLHDKFQRAGAIILGVSRDSIASHEKFREKMKLPFDLLSDPDEKLCRQFNVIREKSLYGRKFLGVERSTFLIDDNGKLREEWRKVKVKGHAAAVLEAVKNLQDATGSRLA